MHLVQSVDQMSDMHSTITNYFRMFILPAG